MPIEALEGGQAAFQIQAYPFRMTAANMTAHQKDEWYDFWKNLKEGYDYFEVTHLPPRIAVCEKHYLVNAAFVDRGARPDPAGACPAWQRLPVSRAPAEQVASTKKANVASLVQASRRGDGPLLWTFQAGLSRLHAWPGDAGFNAGAQPRRRANDVRNQKSEIRNLKPDGRILTSDS